MNMNLFKTLCVKCKIALDRGKLWISYSQFFMILYLFLKNISANQTFSFLQNDLLLILSMIGVLMVIVFIGWFDIVVLQLYQKECQQVASINPNWVKTHKKLNEIIEKLEK